MNKPTFRAGEKARVRLNTECRVIDEEKRIIEYVGSTETVDRYRTRLQGWRLGNYKKNPVFLYGHDYLFPPIGAAKRVWLDKSKRLLFRIQYVPGDLFPFAEFAYQMVKGGWMRATSVGFIPGEVEYPEDWEKDPVLLKSNELLELSQVTVPANPEALVNGLRSLGASEEYRDLFVVNKQPSSHKVIDGSDLSAVRSAVLEWADENGWDGNIEDESIEIVQVPADIESRDVDNVESATEEPVATKPDEPITAEVADAEEATETVEDTTDSREADSSEASPDESGEASGETVLCECGVEATKITDDEVNVCDACYEASTADAEGAAESSEDTAEEEVVKDDASEAAESAESTESEQPDPEPVEAVSKSASGPTFKTSWDSIAGGMAQMLMGDYEDDDPEGDFTRLVEGYVHYGKTLPTMIVDEREVSVVDVDPASLEGTSAVDFVFHNGEDDMWREKRGVILGEEPAGVSGEGVEEEAVDTASVSTAASGAPDMRIPGGTFAGAGAGVGAGPRSAQPSFARKTPEEDVLANIKKAIGEIKDDMSDDANDIRAALNDPELAESLAESAKVDAPEAVSTRDTEDDSASSEDTVAGLADMIRAAVQEAMSDDVVRMTDLSDLAATLGVPSWIDFKSDGRKATEYIEAMVEAAEENRTAPLAEDEMSAIMTKLDGISVAVGASSSNGGKRNVGRIGKALAGRRAASVEALNAELSVVAQAIEKRVSGPTKKINTSSAIHGKRNGRGHRTRW